MSTDVVTGGVPGAPAPSDVPPAGGAPVSPPPTEPAPAPPANIGLTPGEMAVLRLIATDADFRVKFAEDPIAAITGADLKLTTTDYVRLEKLSKDQLEQVALASACWPGPGRAVFGRRKAPTPSSTR